MKKWLIGTAVLFLSACSSIPVSTMLKMSSLDETTLQQTNPEDVRTRITLRPGIQPNLELTNLAMALELAEGSRQFTFPLEQERVDPVVWGGGLFSDDQQMFAYTLRLTDEGVKDFAAMQKASQESEWRGIDLDIHVKFIGHERGDQGTMTLELKLAADEDFFTMFDRYEYTVGETRSYN